MRRISSLFESNNWLFAAPQIIFVFNFGIDISFKIPPSAQGAKISHFSSKIELSPNFVRINWTLLSWLNFFCASSIVLFEISVAIIEPTSFFNNSEIKKLATFPTPWTIIFSF